MTLPFTNSNRVRSGASWLRSRFSGDFSLHVGHSVGEVPRLLDGALELNQNTSVVDDVKRQRGLVATIFARSGDDFYRVTTSILKPDGGRAIGTRLDRSHPAYRALIQARSYEGYALIFERRYYTYYEPIRDRSGQIVGVLFVGLDLTDQSELGLAFRVSSGVACAAFLVSFALSTIFSGDAWALRCGLSAGIAFAASLAAWFMVSQWICAPLNKAHQAAIALAKGDLREQLHVSSGNEVGQVLLAFNLINVGLAKLVGEVDQLARTVVDGTQEIAVGNQDLSSRTELQASSLQQAVDSMGHLEGTVNLNAERASEADQLARTASTVAVEGGQAVSRVVATMHDIQDASRRIGDIISVVDSIAFQTNILALNAAVEAARAGEQGKGFAVVAAEVRALAGRTAQAAKEIKELIGANVQRVQQGSGQVEVAGSTMNDVVGNIQKLAEIATEISEASKEQSGNVQQLGNAVNQIDQGTQQNAALVEQIAAAASSLASKAHELTHAVQAFRLS